MKATTVKKIKKDISSFIEQLNENHDPIIILGKNNNAVMLSEDDWSSLQETLYLLSNPNNSKKIIESINSADFVRFNSIEDLKSETGL